MARERFDLASILSGINPNITSDIIRAANYFGGDVNKLIKRLGKPSKAERDAAKRLRELKNEDVLRQEVADLFTGTRQLGEQAIAQAAGMGEGLSQAIAAAAGGASGVAGGDTRVATMLANAAQSAQAPSREAAVGMRAMGEAGVRSTSEQQALAQANALLRRTEREQELQDIESDAASEREAQLMGLRGDQRTNFLSIISSLLGMRPSGGGYSSGSGAGTTTRTPNRVNLTNPGGLDRRIGNTGYFFYAPNQSASESSSNILYPTSGGPSVANPTAGNYRTPPKRGGYGPWSVG